MNGLTEEQKAIMTILKNAYGKYASDYTDEEQKAICAAASSGVDVLHSEAVMLVDDGLRHYKEHFARAYSKSTSKQDLDDYYQDLSIAIMEHISEWVPEKGKLTTFFQVFFKNACTKTRNSASTFKSRHYENANVDIKRAENALALEGNQNPSAIEIRDYLSKTMKRPPSERTIQNCIAQNVTLTAIDANKDLPGGDMMADPLSKVVLDEFREDVKQVIDTLEPQHKIIIAAELDLIESGEVEPGKRVKTSLLTRECQKKIPSIKAEAIKAMQASAEREFKRKLSRVMNIRMSPVKNTKESYKYLSDLDDDIAMAASSLGIDKLFDSESD